MNERIKELAKQAGMQLIHDRFLTADQTKFAELIVRECCDLVREIDAMEIRKHFGVE